MQSMILKGLIAFFFALILTLVQAKPIDVAKRDVWSPHILYPHQGTVWQVGNRHNVTWDTSNHPVNITNKIGLILLRFDGETTPLILANGFSVLDGKVEVTVPWVVNSNNYSIILFGDSGNDSENFSIEGSGVDF